MNIIEIISSQIFIIAFLCALCLTLAICWLLDHRKLSKEVKEKHVSFIEMIEIATQITEISTKKINQLNDRIERLENKPENNPSEQ